MLRAALSALAAAAFGQPARASTIGPDTRWVVFYGADADPAVFAGFDVVVLDPGFKGKIGAIAGKTFGYLSLGEIRTADPLFARLQAPDALLEENSNWPGTRRVDVRHPQWSRLILDEAIPRLAARGFHGLFFDTLDTPAYLEETEPVRFGGMRAAAVALVLAIRARYPGMPVIMNRGYGLLPELAGVLDAVVAESLLTTWDFQTKIYREVGEAGVAQQLAALRPARSRRPALPVLSLDYWDPADSATIRTIHERERALGHAPYVAPILLDRVVRMPK